MKSERYIVERGLVCGTRAQALTGLRHALELASRMPNAGQEAQVQP